MAENNAAEILLTEPKATGGIFRAPVGSTTDIATANSTLPVGSIGLGLVSEDGLVVTIDEEDSTNILDWAKKVQRSKPGRKTVSAKFSFLQISVDALRAMFGDAAVTVTGDTVKFSLEGTAQPSAYVFEMADGPNKDIRLILHNATPSVSGDISFVTDEATTFEVTLNVAAAPGGESGVDVFITSTDDGS